MQLPQSSTRQRHKAMFRHLSDKLEKILDTGVRLPTRPDCIQYNVRNSAALKCLRMIQCADITLPDPPFFNLAFQFYAIATFP
ncbi:hypothetical protein EVAR_89279_1 [Eumeta japonica]|uniref:Uncharacterized protein n=1 Tax=Eumeta variegata TaxID=151549 RepID=A0A4C1VL86_EUMVA|nr:hypothetical protein EVAR_89279_1 [Eumeta japonica]